MYNNFGKTKLLTLIDEVSKENQVYQSIADTKEILEKLNAYKELNKSVYLQAILECL